MAGGVVLAHLVMGFIVHGASADILNIGVLPSWREVVANSSRGVTNVINYNITNLRFYDIYGKEDQSTYTRMVDVHRKIQHLSIDAIIGPYDNGVALAAEERKIPYLATSPVTKDTLKYTVQLIPELEDFCQALLEFAQKQSWKKISVFYDDDKGLAVLERLMTNHSLSVKAWRLPDQGKRNKTRDTHLIMRNKAREALVQMRKVLVEHSIVICGKLYTEFLLGEARNLAMLSTPPYEWGFYDPGDALGSLFEPYRDIAVNFTVFSLVPYNSTINDITHLNSNSHNNKRKLEYALAHDAVQLLIASSIQTKDTLLQNIKSNQEFGLTGNLQLDAQGKRSNFSVHLTGYTGNESYPHGEWMKRSSHSYLLLNTSQAPPKRRRIFPLKGRTVKVVMILEQPFTMFKRDYLMRRGNDRFEGFAVDLLARVAEAKSFNFEIYLVPDGNFGTKKDGEWNGIIKELLDGEATMSVAPLSINSGREEAVDFTKPFMTRYITVILKIPQRKVSYFEFLNPLSLTVWGCTLAAFVVVSFVLYMLERIGSTKQRTNPQISVRESFWFIFGSLLQGNTDACPITIPGRILTSSWWFFALILISSYTANLAAFLTVKKINTPIKSVTDLAQQTKIKYGTVKNSGVMSFFANTNIEHFSKMWAQMSEIEPDSMVDNTTEGYGKVTDGNYAFFWDTTVNKYKTTTDCDVMEIGPPFDPKGFGIGVPPGATYLDELSMTILKLSDSGILHELENKWWGSRSCPDPAKSSSDETSELQIENVAGVFFILVGGIVIAGLACLAEYSANLLLKANKTNRKDKPDFTTNNKEKSSFL
ncbi:glutamate receptor ionotropic, kainate 2-like isoform X2 [Haliotis rufescens]|uniref:glutamate receptor ionotropic, kainate 2-like isoform X2 n=1 Tax=Haliotis rufescens TaxID=6454 RepID=UPI001EB03AA5|nr:glutamate receptor ionotropic, kainate 2-like isoform X2 [Haliotis rufescens]